ncbi:hypothetical protein FACS189415_1310 [Bacteroidia bacterium]|nr:hypothetical protein FACS189415_1310 [Bacteroidia bacterium]
MSKKENFCTERIGRAKKPLWRMLTLVLVLCMAVLMLPMEAVAAPNEPVSVDFKVTAAKETMAAEYNGVKYGLASVVVKGTDGSGNPTTVASLTITHPVELQLVASTPAGWTATAYAGGTSTTYIITNPTINGTRDMVQAFLETVTFGLTAAGVFPPDNAEIHVEMMAEEMVTWTDDNGLHHYYEFVPSTLIHWDQAYNAAKTRSYNGLQGYLATISSKNEQDLVYVSVSKQQGWLGGTRARLDAAGTKINNENTVPATLTTDATIANSWYWACGPEAGTVFYNGATMNGSGRITGVYQNWANSTNGNPGNVEPNNMGGAEAYLQFALGNSPYWNDLAIDSAIRAVAGYYVEYGGNLNETFTPSSAFAAREIPARVIASYTNTYNGSSLRTNDVYLGAIGDSYDNIGDFNGVSIPPGYQYIGTGNGSAATQGNFSAVTLYVKHQYAPINYTIDYNLNDGSNHTGNPTGYTTPVLNTAAITLQAPTKPGFAFTGWTGGGGAGHPVDIQTETKQPTFGGPNTNITGNLLFTANWMLQHTVDFDAQNAYYTGTPAVLQKVDPGASPSAPAGLTANTLYKQYGNRRFLGWFTDPVGGSQFQFGTDAITADTTLYAHWQQYWTVDFANTNGNIVVAQTVEDGDVAAYPGTPSQVGFNFYGWSADPAATITGVLGVNSAPYNFAATPISADTTIYGVWDPIVYSVSFDVNGGDWDTTGSAPDIVPKVFEYVPNPGSSGTSLPLAFNPPADIPSAPVRAGYNFVGWNSARAGGGSAPTTQTGANVTYYAQWAAIPYAINYDFADTLSYPASPPAANYPRGYDMNAAFPLSIGAPTRPGYDFLGYTCSVGGAPVQTDVIRQFALAQGTMGVVDLTAHWKAIDYGITYILDGGVNDAANPQAYSVEGSFPIAITAPTKEECTFDGWTAAGGLTVNAQTKSLAIPASTYGNITLTAHWTAIDNGDGIEDIDPAPGPSPDANPPGTGTPQTGDNSNVLGWMVALLASVLCALCVLIWRKAQQVRGMW